VKFSPVEEGLSGLALAPDIIVKVQVMPIPMPWINLYNATTYEHSYDSCNGSESWKSSLYLLNEKRVMAQSWEKKKLHHSTKRWEGNPMTSISGPFL